MTAKTVEMNCGCIIHTTTSPYVEKIDLCEKHSKEMLKAILIQIINGLKIELPPIRLNWRPMSKNNN